MLRSVQARLQRAAAPYSAGDRVSRLFDAALDLLFPRVCAVCRAEGSFLHSGCQAALARLETPHCSICAAPGSSGVCRWCAAFPPDFDRIAAPYLMQGPVREMVHSLKYGNVRSLAPDLGRLLASHLERQPAPADVVVPVPLHRRRERARGYNQSALLAREVCKRTGTPLGEGLLRRVRNTAPQVSMGGHEERRKNIDGAFEIAGDAVGLDVLLIDDVVTTGSTMSACAAPLKEAGVASVLGLALARQGRDDRGDR